MRPPEHETLTLAGLSVQVARWGCGEDGCPILALHGFTGCGADFMPLVSGLKRPVIAPDFIGHGGTDAPDDIEPYRMEAVVEQLEALVEECLPDRFMLLGYSMGGRAALHLAPRILDRLEAMVLVGTHPGIEDERWRGHRYTGDDELAARILRRGMEWFQGYWASNPIIATQDRIPEPARSAMIESRARNRPQGLAGSLRGMGLGVMTPTLDHLEALDVPTLLLVGAEDEKYAELAMTMAEILPRAQVSRIPGAGHCAHLERPSAAAQAIRWFLSSAARAVSPEPE
jgi:2-succinyl-6-hydroxy-2,4-cyclohexadiene-1-carboxylate synthase